MRFSFLPVLALWTACVLVPADCAEWYVDDSVSASGDGKSWETAVKTIQEGIDEASHGDTVTVAEGTYVENIHFDGKNIILTSTDPLNPDVVATTIIDGSQSGTVVTFSGAEDATCALSGFTVRNGRAVVGAGILGRVDREHTHATIENNVITDNVAENAGGGLFVCHGTVRNNLITRNSCGIYGGGGLSSCDGSISDNTISFNSATWGGGLSQCDGMVENNLIVGNRAEQYGGGVYDCWGVVQKNRIIENHAGWHGGGLSSCRASIQNNVIAGNTANGRGGGITACGTVINNTIVGNSADLGGGLASCSGIIKNCIVWENNDSYGYQLLWSAEPLYSCIQGWIGGGEGNISQAPLFIDADGPDGNPETYEDNDYHLSASSPCVDTAAGDDALTDDIDGEPRPQAAGTDMGADEYADTDSDGLPDYWERDYFGHLSHDASADSDSDGLTNAEELVLTTNPSESDTDDDGFSDGDEAASGTNPNDPSSGPPVADVYVNAARGDDANGGARPLTAKKTIQAGIDSAQDGNTVVVTEGIYFENINFNGKNIILCSMDPSDPSCVANTVIDGNRAGSVVTFDGTENETCLLTGFTIRNGKANCGGGIYGWKSPNYTHATIRNNAISVNSADYGGGVCGCAGEVRENVISANSAAQGGGLYACDGLIADNVVSENYGGDGGGLSSCSGVVRANTITANWAENGGGLAWCNSIVEGNTISDNQASRSGGGLYACHRGSISDNLIRGNSAWGGGGGLDWCGGVIQSNIIIDNHAYYYQSGGGGLAICYGIENNLIAGNSAPSGGGLYWCLGTVQNNTIIGNAAHSGSGGGICDHQKKGTIRNCIIWGNTAADGTQLYDAQIPSYSCIQDWAGGGEGNIAADPHFVDADGPDDNTGTFDDNNYRLSPDSPCIDAGVNYYWFAWPQRDLDGNCRFVGSRVDIGCYEYGSSRDADGDFLSDAHETVLGTDPEREDTDGDGLLDGIEVLRGTNPLAATPPGVVHVPGGLGTIQEALFLCKGGDQIVLAPGIHYENIFLYGPDVILRSSDPEDPDVVASTILDGSGLGPVVSFSGNETEACVLAGLTIQNGEGGIEGRATHATIQQNTITNNSSDSGGGIGGCHGPIRHNIITGNASGSGGGIANCDGVIEYNLITQNSALASLPGGGVGGGLRNCNGIIQNNTITHNLAETSGGGLAGCDATIQNNLIAANSAGESGGGLYQCGSNVIVVPRWPPELPDPLMTIRNNLIVANSAESGGGLAACSGIIHNSTIFGNRAEMGGGLSECWTWMEVTNCIIWGNTAAEGAGLYDCPSPTYSCIQDWTEGGEGNIVENPRFVDTENGNFRLLPDSPCIDAGFNHPELPETDMAGIHRIMYGGKSLTVDMGAYEFHIWPPAVDSHTGDLTLKWSVLFDKTYSIYYSTDMLTWELLQGGLYSMGDTFTTWTDPTPGFSTGQLRRRYYKVLENE